MRDGPRRAGLLAAALLTPLGAVGVLAAGKMVWRATHGQPVAEAAIAAPATVPAPPSAPQILPVSLLAPSAPLERAPDPPSTVVLASRNDTPAPDFIVPTPDVISAPRPIPDPLPAALRPAAARPVRSSVATVAALSGSALQPEPSAPEQQTPGSSPSLASEGRLTEAALAMPPDLVGMQADPADATPHGRMLDTSATDLVPPRQDIAALDAPIAPAIQTTTMLPAGGETSFAADGSWRHRSGTPGLSRLDTWMLPLEARLPVATPLGAGSIGLTVTPTVLTTGRIRAADLPRFGTGGLTPLSGEGRTQTGVGLALDLRAGILTADLGSTPLGFRQITAVGGITLAPELAPGLTLHVTGERRAVRDSLLSYAGAIDPGTGRSWGGLTRNRGEVGLTWANGPLTLAAAGGAGVISGDRVRSNREITASGGADYAVLQDAADTVKLGLAARWRDDERNLGGFRFGEGGYFSPQEFLTLTAPVSWTGRAGAAIYDLGGALGWQRWREAATTFDPARRRAGLAGDAHAGIAWDVGGGVSVGARMGYRREGPFNDTEALLTGRVPLGSP